MLSLQKKNLRIPMIIFNCPGFDLDDDHLLLLLKNLFDFVEVKCIITNLSPSKMRARLTRGSLDILGLHDIPVGYGEEICGKKPFDSSIIPYLADESQIFNGYELLIKTLTEAEPKSITISITTALTDIRKIIESHEELFFDKVKSIGIMGGVTFIGDEIFPDNVAMNNKFDIESSNFVFKKCHEKGLPISVTMRDLAYNCQVPYSLLENLTFNEVGRCLKLRHQHAIRGLWYKACLPSNHEDRDGLPNDRNKEWFVKVFCGGNEPKNEDIWDSVSSFNLYDPINFCSCIPEIADFFLEPYNVGINKIYGLNSQYNGLKEGSDFARFLVYIHNSHVSRRNLHSLSQESLQYKQIHGRSYRRGAIPNNITVTFNSNT
uniref:Inosine/uridine-preferring nucleoside hydrolase domain-containing protein n=1 Tax=viral metagenome TaxID=1070528 RepID=A0A6C0BCX8_9ZZZZ